jgi:hypothetical protein
MVPPLHPGEMSIRALAALIVNPKRYLYRRMICRFQFSSVGQMDDYIAARLRHNMMDIYAVF